MKSYLPRYRPSASDHTATPLDSTFATIFRFASECAFR